MWASAWNALWNRLGAVAVAVALHSASCTPLAVLALKCLVANILAIVALHRSWSIFKDAGHARFSPSVKKSIGQQPLCIGAFG
jgi:hypothetical protein